MILTGSDEAVTEACGETKPSSEKSDGNQSIGKLERISSQKPMTSSQRHNIKFRALLHSSNPALITAADSQALYSVPSELYLHYRKQSGTPGADTYVSWNFFSTHPPFVEFARSIPVGEQWSFPVQEEDLPTTLAFNKFDVYHVAPDCYVVSDFYNFDQGGRYDSEYRAAKSGDAAEFNIFSAGSLSNPYDESSTLCGIVSEYRPGGGGGGGGW